MIKELRKKLTLLYTVTTGTILTLVVAGLLFYNLRVSEKDALQTLSLIHISQRDLRSESPETG